MPHFSLRRAALFLSSSLFFVPSALPQAPSQTSPNIRVTVDRVNVGVVVTDSRGQFVEGLHRDDFQLFDNGAEQPITDFLSIDEPAQILLLLEAGPAVYLLEGGHLQAVHALLDGLTAGDRVAIARYNKVAEPFVDFTRDKRVVAGTLDQLRFNVGFGQLNLASSVATTLDWLARVPGKKSLVLLSTGVDTSPTGSEEALLARLETTDVRVFAISLGAGLRMAPAESKSKKKNQAVPVPDKAQATAEVFAQADQELKVIAEASGGRAYFPTSTKDFTEVFAEIAQLIRHEYNLGFVPPAHDGKIHSIEVRVASSDAPPTPSYRVDHRQAYVAPQ
jgi:VWFA-related protein